MLYWNPNFSTVICIFVEGGLQPPHSPYLGALVGPSRPICPSLEGQTAQPRMENIDKIQQIAPQIAV